MKNSDKKTERNTRKEQKRKVLKNRGNSGAVVTDKKEKKRKAADWRKTIRDKEISRQNI